MEVPVICERSEVPRREGDGSYHVVDYVDGKDLGIVRGPVAHLSVAFSKHLLLEATPQ